MNNHDDLERRLAARLRPVRVPGADTTWNRIAPLLVEGARQRRVVRTARQVAGASAAMAGILALTVLALALATAPPRESPRPHPASWPTEGARALPGTTTPRPGGTLATPTPIACAAADLAVERACGLDALTTAMPDLDVARRDGGFRALGLAVPQGDYTLTVEGPYVRATAGARWFVVVYSVSNERVLPGERYVVQPEGLVTGSGAEIHARGAQAIPVTARVETGAIFFDATTLPDPAALRALRLTLAVARPATEKGAPPVPLVPAAIFALDLPDLPLPDPAAARTPADPAGTAVRIVGGQIVSIAPAPPFTPWQVRRPAFYGHLLAYAYRPAGGDAAATSAVVDTRGDGTTDDPATAAEAARRARAALGGDGGAALALVYARDGSAVEEGTGRIIPAPARLYTIVQRAAAGRSLPPGEAAWTGAPATFVRDGGVVTLSWLAGDAAITLSTEDAPEDAVAVAGMLAPTTLVAPGAFVPTPTPTLTIPTPLAPAPGGRPTATPCPTVPATVGPRLVCPTNPAAPAGTPAFTEADVRRQYTPQIGDFGAFIAVAAPQLATVEFLTAGEVGQRLGRGMNRPDDQPLCVITIAGEFVLPPPDPGTPPTAYRAVILILDARTGDWFATTGTLR